MRHAETNWNKFVNIACAPARNSGTARQRVTVMITQKAARTLDDTNFRSAS